MKVAEVTKFMVEIKVFWGWEKLPTRKGNETRYHKYQILMY